MFFLLAQFACGILLSGLTIGYTFTHSVHYHPSVPRWAQVLDRLNLGLSIGWSLLGKFMFIYRTWVRCRLRIEVVSQAWDGNLRTMNQDVMPPQHTKIMETLSSPIMLRLLESFGQSRARSRSNTTTNQSTRNERTEFESLDRAPWDQGQDQKEDEVNIKEVLRTQLPKPEKIE